MKFIDTYFLNVLKFFFWISKSFHQTIRFLFFETLVIFHAMRDKSNFLQRILLCYFKNCLLFFLFVLPSVCVLCILCLFAWFSFSFFANNFAPMDSLCFVFLQIRDISLILKLKILLIFLQSYVSSITQDCLKDCKSFVQC